MDIFELLGVQLHFTTNRQSGRRPAFTVKADGFFGEMYKPARDEFPGKVLICFSGSDGRFDFAQRLAEKFSARGLTTLALAYVFQEGLPSEFGRVPIDTLEAAVKRMHALGYEKAALWGISKGGELALTAGSLIPEVGAVVAVSPMNTVCEGFTKKHGVQSLHCASWSFHGRELPYSPYRVKKFPTGEILWNSLKARDITMYGLYEPLAEHPNPEAVIKVENIRGPILLISSKMDRMWPSDLASRKIMERLQVMSFPYLCRHLSYDYGSHMFVPIDVKSAKLFRAERKYPKQSQEARMDSLEKTLDFLRAC